VGRQMFPDKKNPDDKNATKRRKVEIKVTIAPKVKDATVFLKSFDVDDPDPLAAC